MNVRTTAGAILVVGLTATACALIVFALGGITLPAPITGEPWEARPLQWVQALSWVAALGTLILAIYTGQTQSALNREQRAEELNWKRTQAAVTLNEDMMKDASARAAMLMIDYPSGRPYTLPDNSIATINNADVIKALVGHFGTKQVPDRERFIRDCFDEFLYRVGILEHYISRELVAFKDAKHPTDYYVKRMINVGLCDAVQNYAHHYGFERTEGFLGRFGGWPAPPPSAPAVVPSAAPPPLASESTVGGVPTKAV